MFRHKAWAFVGIIYGVDPICLGDIKPEIEAKLEYGRYQPFYRVLIDDHSEFTHYGSLFISLSCAAGDFLLLRS